MGEEAKDGLEERLQQMEKQVQELRVTSLAGAVGVILLCFFSLFRILSGSVPEEIRAKRIAVVDTTGNTGIVLAVRENQPGISFHDREGNPRAVFELQGRGRPVLSFLDEERYYRATFGLSEEGNPGIAFWDNEYRLRANFKLAGSGEPALGLFGREGEAGSRSILFLSDEHGPFLNMRDAAGEESSFP